MELRCILYAKKSNTHYYCDSSQSLHHTLHEKTRRDRHHYYEQDAQLSQRDHAAVCVIVFAKSRTLELGDNDLRTL